MRNTTFWVFVGVLLGVLGASLIGSADWTTSASPPAFYEFILLLKSSFLQLLRMMIAPLIFFSLIGGITGIGGVVRLQKMGGVTVAYYVLTTSIAIVLGLIAVLVIHPWTNYPPGDQLSLGTGTSEIVNIANNSIVGILTDLLSRALVNPFSALVDLNILGIVFNAIFAGLAMILVLPQDSPLFVLIADINKIIAKILSWIILTLPIGVFAIIFDFTLRLSASGEAGGDILIQMLMFATLVIGVTLFHGALVLPLLAALLGGMSPMQLFGRIVQPLLVAFSTSSSAATLPVTMRTSEEKLNVSPGVSSFVLPLGATMNMDGTALFEAIAAVFLAYIYGIELSTAAMVTIFVMAMIASIGAPGMPSASMAGMQMVLLAVGIPLEAIALLMVMERPLDTIRTAVNVEGDLVGSLVVQSYLNRNGDFAADGYDKNDGKDDEMGS